MRIGFLGPSEGDLEGLARAAELVLNRFDVTRAIYLGADGALDDMVNAWATALVGNDPDDASIWDRALAVMSGSTEAIDTFVRGERGRSRLRALEALAKLGHRGVEIFGDRVAIVIHDKALLDEEDILPASYIVFGKSDAPLLKRVGSRWFISPGKIGAPGGGIIVLHEDGGEVHASVHDSEGQITQSESLTIARTAKVRVLGDS